MRLFRRAVLVASALALVSCSGEGPGSITAPPLGGLTAAIGGAVSHTQGREVLERVEVFVDNTKIADTTASPARSAIGFNDTRSISNGRHTLRIRVSAQTSSPNSYRTSTVMILIFEGTQVRKQIELPDRSQSLTTGQSIEYTFDV